MFVVERVHIRQKKKTETLANKQTSRNALHHRPCTAVHLTISQPQKKKKSSHQRSFLISLRGLSIFPPFPSLFFLSRCVLKCLHREDARYAYLSAQFSRDEINPKSINTSLWSSKAEQPNDNNKHQQLMGVVNIHSLPLSHRGQSGQLITPHERINEPLSASCSACRQCFKH